MAEAVALSKLHSLAEVDRALGAAAIAGRFAENDLISILDYQAVHGRSAGPPNRTTLSSRAPPPGPASARPSAEPAQTTPRRRKRRRLMATPIAHRSRRPRRPAGRGHRADQTAQTPALAAVLERHDPHREGPTLGSRRGRAGPARRGSRRPGRREPAHPPQAGRVPYRQDLRRLGRDEIVHTPRHPGRAQHWSGSAAGRISCICGPSGTGKSHFTEALGQTAVEAGLTVAWFTIEDLGPWSAGTAPTTPSPEP